MLTITEELRETCKTKEKYTNKIVAVEISISDFESAIQDHKQEIAYLRERIADKQKELKPLKRMYKKACEKSIRIQQELIAEL